MPQFILPRDGAVSLKTELSPAGSTKTRWEDLDEFTQGYIQALFFTNTGSGDSVEWETPEYQHRMEEGQTDGDLPNDIGFADLDPNTLADIIADCREFQKTNESLLTDAYDKGGREGEYNAERAGMDFWYTRVGHGVGYWDRGLGQVGNMLTYACKPTVEINPYFHGGKVYI